MLLVVKTLLSKNLRESLAFFLLFPSQNTLIMTRQIFLVLSLLLAIINSSVLAQVPTVKCDVNAKLACNNFRNQKGKLCAMDPLICYHKDTVENEKPCTPETENSCETFKNHNGYLCSDFFCLITVNKK